MTPHTDEDARRVIRNHLDETVIVEAAAGTGKTTEMVGRIVAVLRTGRTTVDRIVAVTFTRKAAGELKIRLRQELDRARQAEVPKAAAAGRGFLETEVAASAERRALEDALEHLEEAQIGTIHAFCGNILRQRPVEAGIDPNFEELDEDSAYRLFGLAFRRWLQERLAADSPGVRRAFLRMAWLQSGADERGPADRLRQAGWQLLDWRDHPADWMKPAVDLRKRAQELTARARAILAKDTSPSPALRDFEQTLRRFEGRKDYPDVCEALLLRLWKGLPRRTRKDGGEREDFRNSLEEFQRLADADLAAQLQREFASLIAAYEDWKRRSGKLDFLDLLLRTRDLVRGNRHVREYLQQRFTHIFVDEYQDTDPLQAEILLLLAADDPAEEDWRTVRPRDGKLFLVADPKQSIYRFRRADVLLYQEVTQALVAKGARKVRLSRSFRAVRPIQQAVNTAFEAVMKADPVYGQPDYVGLEQRREAIASQPAVIALPVPAPYSPSNGRIAKNAIEASLPGAVAAFVDWLLRASGWKVSDPDDPSRLLPIESRHICVLFRRFLHFTRDVTVDYVRAFEAHSIPHLLVGGRSFHEREEVETLRAAVTAIEWPDDELNVYATLKGSLFGISDSALLRFRHEYGHWHPFRRWPKELDADLQPVADALGILRNLHSRRNWQPAVSTLQQLLESVRAHAGFAVRPGGHQALANVHRICDLARAFEASGGISFRAFVEQLREQAEAGETPEAPVVEEGAEGVRLMTVHAAKGLEFPIVILADITCNATHQKPDRYVDSRRGLCALRLLGCTPLDLLANEALEHGRDQAEALRLAYVASTRARDLLVLPAVADEPVDFWLGALNRAIYPPAVQRRRARPAKGCPPFGPDGCVARPPYMPGIPQDSVQPGAHTIEAGGYEVVWWDPHLLRPTETPAAGIADEESLKTGTDAAAESLAAYRQWREARAAAVLAASRPAVEAFIATEASAPPPELFPVRMEVVPRLPDRPGGRRFGTLVHALLRDVAWDGARGALEAAARMEARVLGATPEEELAAVEAALAALDHPLLQRARRSRCLLREFPLLLRLADNTVFEGTVDLAFREDRQWIVVDFKTDLEIQAARYRRQLEWYCYALSRIESAPAEGWLLNL